MAAERRGRWGRRSRWASLFGALLLAVLACASDRRARFDEALDAYQHALRWGEVGVVASYLGDRPRQHLLARGAAWRELRIVEVSLTRVDWLHAATVRVVAQVEWYGQRSGRLGATLLAQRWVDGATGWQLREQRVIGGTPLPVLTLP